MSAFDPMSSGIQPVSGDYLYIAGSDLFNRQNQPSQHMPYHLARYLERLDLVGYTRFYDGPPAPAWQRLKEGLGNVLFRRLQISQDEGIRTISVRRLRLPGSLDPRLQDLWVYTILRPHLKPKYDLGIVDGPESAFLARQLIHTGRIETMIYYDIDYYPGVFPAWAKILAKREMLCITMADAVVSVSRPLTALRVQQGAKLAVCIPNGVDFERFFAANELRRVHPPTLIYMGSLDMRWGVDLPLQAMPMLCQQFPDITLLIAGRGPAEQELRQLALSLGVEQRVHFKGFVPYADLPALLAQADIGIATSRADVFRQYASPLKIVEYMSAGLPVICSGGGEAEKMIAESNAGANIPFDPHAFVQAVQRMLTNPGGLDAYRQAAIQYARSRSWEQMGNLMAQLVCQITRKSDFSNG